jgi:threonine dehydratase
MDLPSGEKLARAAVVVGAAMSPTPQYAWPLLNARVGTEVWVKHENHTPIGAFKVRGGLIYLDWLKRTHPAVAGVAAATRGNFGQAIGFAAKRYKIPAATVVPFGNSIEKNRAMRALGVELIEHGDDFQAANEFAGELALDRGYHRVPSFHELLVHGAGTYAMEFFHGAPELDTVYMGIGLGSSICGLMAARAALKLKTRIVGVVAAASPSYAISFRERKPVSHPAETQLADGLACRVPDADALRLMLNGIERMIEVSEQEIAAAMIALYEDTHNVAEGAGAAALAGLMKERETMRGRRAGIVLSGGNVDREVFARVLMPSRDGQKTHAGAALFAPA